MRLKAYTIPVVVSVFLHAMMLVMLLSAWDARPEPREVQKPRVVKAKVVEFTPKSERQAEQEAAQQKKVIDMRQRQQEREQQEAERRRQQEAEARAQQEREQEQKQQEQAERERREAEAQAQREREAEEQRQREERAEQERQERQERLERALADEEEFFEAQQSEQVAQSFTAVMRERIEDQWSRPPSARTGMRCVLEIQLVPTGKVVNVTVVESSGNAAFDRSAEQAVKRVDRFEELQDVPSNVFERHFRQLRLVFNPEDLRQ